MFQNQVNLTPAPGVVGGIASMNPIATVDAGPGGLVAGANGVLVGRFAWNTYTVAGGPGTASNANTGQPRVPDGFIANLQQGLITTFLSDQSLTIPSGMMVTEYQRGDFWAYSNFAEAALNNKVFANLLDGSALIAAAGSFPTNAAGTAAVVVATTASLTNYTMTIASVTSGVVAVGQLVTGPGIAPNTYIESFGTFNGSTGTVFLSQNPVALAAGQSFSTAPTTAFGGATGNASFATNVMTAAAPATGAYAAGQLIQSAGVAANTYIVQQLTGTPGGAGTYQLSTTPGTIASQAVSASAWIETSWFCNSPGNVMDLVKIGVRN